jgi:hypothetical protein
MRELSDGYVYNASYTLTCSDVDSDGLTREFIHSGSVNFSRSQTLIPYEDLTEELVISWIESELGDELTSIKADLEQKLNEVINPTKASGLPWI